MKTALTILSIIVAIIIASVIGFVIYAKSWWDDVKFKPDIQSIINKLPQILAQLITNQTLPITVLVDNPSNFGVSVENFQVKGAYKSTSVFQSKIIPLLSIPKNASNYAINGQIELFANLTTAQLINDIIANKKPTIQLTVHIEKFGIKKDFTFDYQIK